MFFPPPPPPHTHCNSSALQGPVNLSVSGGQCVRRRVQAHAGTTDIRAAICLSDSTLGSQRSTSGLLSVKGGREREREGGERERGRERETQDIEGVPDEQSSDPLRVHWELPLPLKRSNRRDSTPL